MQAQQNQANGGSVLAVSGQPLIKRKPVLCQDVKNLVFNYLKPSELVLTVAKLNSVERRTLIDHREGADNTGYALNSSINKKKPVFNSFDSNA